jgi:hypothetical protein
VNALWSNRRTKAIVAPGAGVDHTGQPRRLDAPEPAAKNRRYQLFM